MLTAEQSMRFIENGNAVHMRRSRTDTKCRHFIARNVFSANKILMEMWKMDLMLSVDIVQQRRLQIQPPRST